MSKKFIKSWIPDQNWIKKHKYLSILGSLLHDPNIWHLNKNSVSTAFAIGLFFAFVPIPFQMLFSGFFAILFRANLPIAVATVWITNPITMPPIFYLAYKLGKLILQMPTSDLQFAVNLNFFVNKFSEIWPAFLLGCFIFSVVFSLLGYFFVRILWKLTTRIRWKKRQSKRNRQH